VSPYRAILGVARHLKQAGRLNPGVGGTFHRALLWRCVDDAVGDATVTVAMQSSMGSEDV
jgi:hypothetical protein